MAASGRTLTDGDVAAIAEALESRLAQRLVSHAGTGLLRMAWRGAVLLIVWLAVYGVTAHVVNR